MLLVFWNYSQFVFQTYIKTVCYPILIATNDHWTDLNLFTKIGYTFRSIFVFLLIYLLSFILYLFFCSFRTSVLYTVRSSRSFLSFSFLSFLLSLQISFYLFISFQLYAIIFLPFKILYHFLLLFALVSLLTHRFSLSFLSFKYNMERINKVARNVEKVISNFISYISDIVRNLFTEIDYTFYV